MTDHIRHLAVFVDEPDPGCFYWVVIESVEDASVWADIKSGEQSFDMWIDAFTEGNKALLQFVNDERIGPRASGEGEDTSPVG